MRVGEEGWVVGGRGEGGGRAELRMGTVLQTNTPAVLL